MSVYHPTTSNDQGTSVPADEEAMDIGKSDSSLIREYYKELVHALTLSKPARESLAIGLYGRKVLSNLEKQEIMNESISATHTADKLVGYIINRIDSQEHCDNIWGELHSIEALTDILKKIKPVGVAVSTVSLIQPPGRHPSLTTVESSTLTINSEPVSESQEMTRLRKALEERDKEIMRMREEIKELQQETTLKHQLLTIDEQQELCSRLFTAAEKGDVSLVRHLLQLGANVDYRDISGCTPLHEASTLGHTEVVQILLSNGASIEAMNIYLQSPLLVAIGCNRTNVAILLISEKANIYGEDMHGQSPALMATVLRNTAVVKCLMSNGVEKKTIDKYRLPSDWEAKCIYYMSDSQIAYKNKTTGKEQYGHPNYHHDDLDL